tara:strand:- start:1499 stop:2218 length:720 start_codon:yes stop_codon:yes gene_type:complete
LNALLLSAGFGTRLGSITKSKPKCLVKINKQTLIDIWIKKLKNTEINKIYINTHFMSNLVKAHIHKYHKENKKIIIIEENKILGTSNTIRKNINLFKKEKLLLIHTDNYTNFNINYLINSDKKKPRNCGLTMLSFITNQPEKTGTLFMNEDKVLSKYFHKDSKSLSKMGNGAIYILSKKFLKNYELEFKNDYDFSKDIIPKQLGKAYIYKTKSFYIDIGDPISLKLARKWGKKNKYLLK